MKLINLLNKIANGEIKEGTKLCDVGTFVFKNGRFVDENDNSYIYVVDDEVLNDEVEIIEEQGRWEPKEHRKTILDGKEREYLSALIKPFRDRAKIISKHEALEKEWVTITMEKGRLDDFDLPRFPKGTMYKGMEVDKEYTLEELDL